MWTFSQSTGRIELNKSFFGLGYAGNDFQGACKNNHFAQHIVNHGPLPCGIYTIGKSKEGTHMGPFAIELIPDPLNNMFGRSAFFIHGDSSENPGTASNGCIITSRNNRNAIFSSIEKKLEVVP